LDRIHDVLNEHPGVVMVLFGGNDYLHGVPIDETFNNLELIVEKIQRKGAVVILLGIQGGILEDPFESRFRALARKKGALYVPNVLDGLIGNTDYMSDEIHPNDKGQRVIADKIYPVLDRVL
jgi:acyl-CoA thioesterase-1